MRKTLGELQRPGDDPRRKRLGRHWFGKYVALGGIAAHSHDGLQVFDRFDTLGTNLAADAVREIDNRLAKGVFETVRGAI